MIVLNEKAYAEECLQKKSIGDKPFYTLTILAKYYYYCFGYRKAKITALLTDFMEKYYPRYNGNKAIWNESIEKIAKNAGKYTLFEIDGVWITKAEFETIENIKSKTLEKLAFTLLCLAKLGNMRNPKNNGWVNNDAKEVFTLAKISCSVSNRYEQLGKLHQLSLLEFPRRIDNLSCRVTYINDDSEKKLFISDFRELGYEYLKYLGNNYKRCQECGKLFKVSKNHMKICPLCSPKSSSEAKIKYCLDCGRRLEVSLKNTHTIRCKQCQEIKNRENKHEWYEKKKASESKGKT